MFSSFRLLLCAAHLKVSYKLFYNRTDDYFRLGSIRRKRILKNVSTNTQQGGNPLVSPKPNGQDNSVLGSEVLLDS
jgi:hypothetical protein